jgi:molybdopterin/thiamine biosynthesis adenylyltransferase
VLVIGAGGLVAPVLFYLAGAGVGTLGVSRSESIDGDKINLQREVIHGTEDIGAPKVDSAAYAIGPPPSARYGRELHGRLSAANALDLISRYDIVADGSDNLSTPYLVADACFFAKKPLVTAAVGTFDGAVPTLPAHERGPDGNSNSTYRCLFPPPPGTVPACQGAGILGPFTAIMGSMMALEIIREIVGFGESLVGRLLMIDTREMRFETVGRKPDCHNTNSEAGQRGGPRVLLCGIVRRVTVPRPRPRREHPRG